MRNLYWWVASALLLGLKLISIRPAAQTPSMCPSSGEITVYMRHWYLSLCMGGVWSAGWIEASFTPTSRPGVTQTEWKIPMSHRHSDFSWWWAHGCPKHVDKRNKYTKQNCAPSWIYLQDFWSSFQNIQFSGPYTPVLQLQHSTSFFFRFKSNLLLKRVLCLLNTAFLWQYCV